MLYLLTWTTRGPRLFYPPNRVDQQLQLALAIQGKRSGTSYMFHVSPLTFKQRHLRTKLPSIALDACCYVLLLASYVRNYITARGPSPYDCTPQWPCLYVPSSSRNALPRLSWHIYLWVLAPAVCSRFYARLTHVMYTFHATRHHTVCRAPRSRGLHPVRITAS